MKKLTLGIIIIQLLYCTLQPVSDLNCPDTVQEAIDFVVNNIKYKTDYEIWGIKDYWQSPKQTYNLRVGDCEDKAILLMYYMHLLGKKTSLVVGKSDYSINLHAFVKHGGILICSTSGTRYTRIRQINTEYSYDQIMFLCGHGYK